METIHREPLRANPLGASLTVKKLVNRLVKKPVKRFGAWTRMTLVGMAASLGISGIVFGQSQSSLQTALPDIRDAYGVSIADFDGDGSLDLYLVGFRSLNRLLLNQGHGVFSDASIPSGTGGHLMPQGNLNLELGASAADFDNDGDIDLMVAGWGEGLALLRNRGDGTFEDVTLPLGIRRDLRANMAAFSDIDSDGWLDLLLTHESGPMRLYRNERGLIFHSIDLTTTGLPLDSGSQAALFTDLDLDGKADLVVSGWHRPAQIFQSLGDFHFKPIAMEIPWPNGVRCNAALHGDLDRDGDIDLIFTARGLPPQVLINHTDPPLRSSHPGDWKWPPKPLRLSPCPSNCGLSDTLDGYGGALLDIDGDGDLDLFMTGRQPERLYRNEGGRFFLQDAAAWQWPLTGSHYSTGFMAADFGGDEGWQAVAANRDTGCVLIRLPPRHLSEARVHLHGVLSNPQGLGTSLTLWRLRQDDTTEQPWEWIATSDLPGAQGYLSSYVGDPVFTLPDTTSEYRVRVVFPSGKVVTRRLPRSGERLDVWEAGFLGGLSVKSLRLIRIWLGDAAHLKRILAAFALMLIALTLIRWAVRATARNIARRDYTKTLETKNREMETLLSELHRTQEQLIQHEKLASIGQLVAGIAHELNNPIGFIYANLHQISRYLKALPSEALDERSIRNLAKVDEALRESQDGAIRVRDIVQNLRGLARGGSDKPGSPPAMTACDLRDALEKALSVARTGFAPGITVEKQLSEIPMVLADTGQMQQVFLNLLVNAGQAMGEHGHMTLISRTEMGHTEKGFAVVEVKDNGPGIAPEHLAKLFDPFFTTKPVGQGLGLGLHLAYTMVKAHGGELTAQSHPGDGACFTLRMPAMEKASLIHVSDF